MVRIIAFLAGLGFCLVLAISFIVGASSYISDPPQPTAEDVFHQKPRELHLESNGPFGKYNREQVQRGFQVFSDVCSACHSLKFVAFRDLKEIGYSDAEVKAIANQWKIEQPSINPDTGEASTRKSIPADHFPPPFPNEVAARAANNGGLPPDLSLMAKAREGGPAYIYSLITGYREQPPELLKRFPDAKTPAGTHYNPWFANLNIKMPPPLTTDGQVQYKDGTKPTVDQMAQDVAAFLAWAAEPKLESRHHYGVASVIFLIIFSVLTYMAYQNIWYEKKHGRAELPAE